MMRGNERWKDVVGWEGYYEVSNMGRVRSVERIVRSRGAATRIIKSKVLKPLAHSGGYQQASLSREGKMHRRFIHRLVLEAFCGKAPVDFVACHNNGDPTDNRLDNLRWDSVAANSADKKRHGTQPLGEKCPGSKLSVQDVQIIRARCGEGVSQRQVAQDFSIAQQTVSEIVSGQIWRHV